MKTHRTFDRLRPSHGDLQKNVVLTEGIEHYTFQLCFLSEHFNNSHIKLNLRSSRIVPHQSPSLTLQRIFKMVVLENRGILPTAQYSFRIGNQKDESTEPYII